MSLGVASRYRHRRYRCFDCLCVIVLAVMLVGLPTAQAAGSILTLACQGTITKYEHPTVGDAKPEWASPSTLRPDGSGLRYGVSGQNNQH
jgi:hypothetical protein